MADYFDFPSCDCRDCQVGPRKLANAWTSRALVPTHRNGQQHSIGFLNLSPFPHWPDECMGLAYPDILPSLWLCFWQSRNSYRNRPRHASPLGAHWTFKLVFNLSSKPRKVRGRPLYFGIARLRIPAWKWRHNIHTWRLQRPKHYYNDEQSGIPCTRIVR